MPTDMSLLKFMNRASDGPKFPFSTAVVLLGKVATDTRSFLGWFEDLELGGPGQDDPLFDWIAKHANREQFLRFAKQEYIREGSFSIDLANTEMRIARNRHLKDYFAEMRTRGHALTYESMLSEILKSGPTPEDEVLGDVHDARKLAASLSSSAQFVMQSTGALAMRELAATRRLSALYQAAHRLGFDSAVRIYHSHGFRRVESRGLGGDALYLMVHENPQHTKSLAEGAWLTLECGARCFKGFRKQLFVY